MRGSQIIDPYLLEIISELCDGEWVSGYQTQAGKFISECDWRNDGVKVN
jgi:hypothetical protein